MLGKGDGSVSQARSSPTSVDAGARQTPRREVLTGAQITKESQSDIQNNLSFFNIFLLVFAGVALFVSCFIIYNTFSIIVAQRQRETALLRAVGASRRQVLGNSWWRPSPSAWWRRSSASSPASPCRCC